MWTCLLMLYAQFAVVIKADTVSWPHCPTNCSCSSSLDSTTLYVDCHGCPDIDQEQPSHQIDSMLSTVSGSLEQLSISNTALTHVPRSVCRLTTLTSLSLDNNRLSGLPDNCFTNLSNLLHFSASDNEIQTLQNDIFDGLTKLETLNISGNRISFLGLSVSKTSAESKSVVNTSLTQVPCSLSSLTTLTDLNLNNNRLARLPDNCLTKLTNLLRLTATDNAIETLQVGVFDGMRKLEFLDLSRNRISSIGLSVFATSAKLSGLFTIVLSENSLTSLEPWIYDRGLIGSFEQKVMIDLSHNKISKFTNKMGLSNYCYNEIPFVYVNLQNNSIKHYMDIMDGWQVDITQLLICYKVRKRSANLVVSCGESITCDCVNYQLYNMFSMLDKPFSFEVTIPCNLTDPLTKTSTIVNGLYTDLSLFVCELTDRCPAGCVCVHRPANATLHVYCSNKNFTVLPLELPELPDSRTKYKLDFYNNRFHHLEYRDYFVNTSVLDVSDCTMNEVIDREEIAKIPFINFFGNKLTMLPPSFLSRNITTGKLNLANNPWDCSCDNKWMSDFLISIADQLTQEVLCYSPPRLRDKNIIQVSSEFCVDPASQTVTTITSSIAAVAAAVILSVVVIVYRLRVKLYVRFNFHPFDRDECLGEDMDYDVFLSCSSNDNLPHGNRIRELLEQNGYRVCYPPRDFLAGGSIYDNIYQAIVHSKRTVCLLTEHFCRRFVPLKHVLRGSDVSSLKLLCLGLFYK